VPSLELKDRYQYAVLWAFAGYDASGEVVVDDPVEVRVRWEEQSTDPRRGQILGPDGNLVTLLSTVVVDRRIEVGSLMWKGRLRDYNANVETQVREVVLYSEIPDLKNRNTRREVGLGFYKGTVPDGGGE
jgi:hypothetical protein